MCRYWKKDYTCEHVSARHIDLCQSAYTNNNIICTGLSEDDEIRKSYFPCFDCVRDEARREKAEKDNADRQATNTAREAQEKAAREKQVAEKKARHEQIRNEARETAAKEREEEARRKAQREQEMERAKKDGGMWIETNSGKKGKGRRGPVGTVGNSIGACEPRSGPPSMGNFTAKLKENEGPVDKGSKHENSQLNFSGRAGNWGPPKKILSRKENGDVSK